MPQKPGGYPWVSVGLSKRGNQLTDGLFPAFGTKYICCCKGTGLGSLELGVWSLELYVLQVNCEEVD